MNLLRALTVREGKNPITELAERIKRTNPPPKSWYALYGERSPLDRGTATDVSYMIDEKERERATKRNHTREWVCLGSTENLPLLAAKAMLGDKIVRYQYVDHYNVLPSPPVPASLIAEAVAEAESNREET